MKNMYRNIHIDRYNIYIGDWDIVQLIPKEWPNSATD